MSVRIVKVRNPDGTTTEVTMVCVQDAKGNTVTTEAVDERTCRFGPSTPSFGFIPTSPAELGGIIALLLVCVVIILM
jgi:hypothetical protein